MYPTLCAEEENISFSFIAKYMADTLAQIIINKGKTFLMGLIKYCIAYKKCIPPLAPAQPACF